MRVLVTGHRGYVGTVLVPMLNKAGHEVVGLDTDLYHARDFGGPAQMADVRSLDVDVRDVAADALAGFDAVVHLAALSNDPLGNLDPVLMYDVNHHATVRLARLSREGECATPPLLLVVQQLRRRQRVAPRRVVPAAPGYAIRRVEGPRRTRHQHTGRSIVHCCLAAQCDRLRREPPRTPFPGSDRESQAGGAPVAASPPPTRVLAVKMPVPAVTIGGRARWCRPAPLKSERSSRRSTTRPRGGNERAVTGAVRYGDLRAVEERPGEPEER